MSKADAEAGTEAPARNFPLLTAKAVVLASTATLLFLTVATSHAAPVVKTGAKKLIDSGCSELDGKRVGLITNHTAMVDDTHLIDLLHANNRIRLVALFAPEHGLRGVEEDGVSIGDGKDGPTGTAVYSLYGKTRRPTRGMLTGVDLLLFDIQDIGARFYTFISTMGLAMQAAAQAGIPFLVLDRPNPLGGEYYAGDVVEKRHSSFVGMYPIPVAHGLTMGELALLIKGERMLPGLEKLDLRVIKMEGWQRTMLWPETGLPWIRTSPNIPDFETALLYPGLCFIEATSASEGRGTETPFKVTGYPGLNGRMVADTLNRAGLPGVRFEATTFTPHSIPGRSSSPKFRDQPVPGVRLILTDYHTYRPVQTAVHLLGVLYGAMREKDQKHFFRKEGFDELAGTSRLRQSLQTGVPPALVMESWRKDLETFGKTRRKYLLY